MSKKLIEEKLLNQLLYAVRFHVELIETNKYLAVDDESKNKILKSIDTLKEIIDEFETPEIKLKDLKRKAFSKYLESKNILECAKKINDKDYIKHCEAANKKDLEVYIQCKNTYENLKKNDI